MRLTPPAVLLAVSMATATAAAQTPAPQAGAPPQAFTLEQAIRYAADHYPTVRAAIEQVNASAAGVDVARGAYLPRLDSTWQTNRATANNIFGQLLPQSVIPPISGPVLPSPTTASAWSSAVGALASWEPIDLGLRRATVAGADAAVARARADEALTRLDVQDAVGAAFLEALAAQEAVSAVQADLDRRNVLRNAVQALVDNQLRPGADLSRAEAERAAAETRVIEARRDATLAQVALTRLLGITAAAPVAANGGALLAQASPAPAAGSPPPPAAHPLAQAQQAAVEQAQAAEHVLARTDLPRVFVESSVSARGSGASAAGPFESGAGGLGLERANWAAGVQVVFPNVFDVSSLRARKAAAAASSRAEAARYDEALLTVTSRQQSAAAQLDAARAVAANTPVQLDAARQSESQARARYDAGLTSIVEVADAQSLLAQAEVQDRLARVAVWQALLAAAVARGDLGAFMDLARQP
jgi:outer membrane protein